MRVPQQVAFCKCLLLPTLLLLPHKILHFRFEKMLGILERYQCRQGSCNCLWISTVIAFVEQKHRRKASAGPPPAITGIISTAGKEGVSYKQRQQTPWFLRCCCYYYCCGCTSSNTANQPACEPRQTPGHLPTLSSSHPSILPPQVQGALLCAGPRAGHATRFTVNGVREPSPFPRPGGRLQPAARFSSAGAAAQRTARSDRRSRTRARAGQTAAARRRRSGSGTQAPRHPDPGTQARPDRAPSRAPEQDDCH
ncbi:PREDICTED: uncharacterized protein LOC105575357 [Cercocebus atys]|uniref:uncharacterized protein LOC105575357 n=1 Tax=Cercocebus atys TaxID=9531 RepID=UPI0005F51723|nr:PREDICTED: uncharacterized protein LOC105575357 [Cercocebus atys]